MTAPNSATARNLTKSRTARLAMGGTRDVVSAATAAADRTIEDLELDAIGRHWSGDAVSLRSMLLTVLLDTTRHAGHSDIVRELIDGTTGDRDSPSGFYGASDEEYRSNYLARVRGEIDTPNWWDYIRTRGKKWS